MKNNSQNLQKQDVEVLKYGETDHKVYMSISYYNLRWGLENEKRYPRLFKQNNKSNWW